MQMFALSLTAIFMRGMTYTRAEQEAEVEAALEAMEVGGPPEEGGPRQYRRAIKEDMEVGAGRGGGSAKGWRPETIHAGGAGGH